MPVASQRRRHTALGWLAVAVLLAVSAACSIEAAPPGGSRMPGASAGDTQTLAFAAATIDGQHFDGATLAGRPAVLWFWAAWCPRCRAKAGEVRAVQADYAGKVTVVGVAGLGSGPDAMARFVRDLGLDGFTNLADDEGAVWRHFGVAEQELFVLIDQSGHIVYKGPLSGSELRERVAAIAA